MIVIGTMDWPKTLETGQFYCPHCEKVQAFRRRVSRPFLTVYFIPVVPIGGLQEYVECRNCSNSFESSIVGDVTPESERSFETDLLKVAALTMLEDQTVTEAEIARAIVAVGLIGHVRISREDLGQTCSIMRSRQMRLGGLLWTARQRWTREECLRMLQVIFLVASAEGELSAARLKALMHAASTLGISNEELESCVMEAEQIVLADRNPS